jgi:lipoate-protein ligase A
MTERVGRLLPPDVGAAAANMALDQSLLESAGRRRCPTLRFYTWRRPTLSLGYFQSLADRVRHPESESLDCVRRGTGGGAIVHHHELTYSLVMPSAVTQAGPREALYRQIHQAFAEVLSEWGVRAVPHRLAGQKATGPELSPPEPFLCFQRRTSEDLVVAGYKVLGSAQRRTRDAMLQHGSLLLRASVYAPQLPGIGDLGANIDLPPASGAAGDGAAGDEGDLGCEPLRDLVDRLAGRIGRELEVDRWQVEPPDGEEQRRSEQIARERFASPQWLARR